MHRIKQSALLITSLALAGTVNAEVLANYNLSGSDATSRLSSQTWAEHLSASNITYHNVNLFGYLPGGSGTQYPTPALTFTPAVAQPTYSFSNTYQSGTYISFTLTPQSGYALTLESVNFKLASGGGSTPDASVRAFYILSSVTGFAADETNILLQDSNAGTMPSRPTKALGDYTLNLTGDEWSNITVPVEFRIYFQTDGNTRAIDFGGATFNGSVQAIPEASSYAVTFAATSLCIGLSLVRRRQNRHNAVA